MEWLKDKKNTPIVIGLAVFLFLAGGGLIAWEAGAFTPAPAALPATGAFGRPLAAGAPTMPPGPMSPGSPPNSMSSGPMTAGGPPSNMGSAPGPFGSNSPAGARTASAPGKIPTGPAAPVLVNPGKGPDPFYIPGGQKVLTKRMLASSGATGTNGMKVPLREILPVFNLFKPEAPAPPPEVTLAAQPAAPPPNLKVIGIVNSADGIYAILEVNGQSQTVKPGDSLLDGSKVGAIQTTSVTVRTSGGATITVPLTVGSGQSDDTQNGPGNNPGMNGGQPFGQGNL